MEEIQKIKEEILKLERKIIVLKGYLLFLEEQNKPIKTELIEEKNDI